MFFLFGSPRSGTTFVKEILCQHPEIVIPHETDFIVPMAFILDRVREESIGKELIASLICSSDSFDATLGQYLTRTEVIDAVSRTEYSIVALLKSVFGAVARKSKSSIYGDKSPNDLGYVSILHKVNFFHPEVKIIHLVRDVRDVVLSLKKVPWAPSGIERYFPSIWSVSNTNLRRFSMEGNVPYLFLRYEDFIEDTQLEVKKICSFLGVEFSLQMLDYAKLGRTLSHLPHHMNLGMPPMKSRCYAWKRDGAAEIIDECTRRACNTLLDFGYDVNLHGK